MSKFPPSCYIVLVANHCPLSLYLYIQLWEKAENDGRIQIKKEGIKREFCIRKVTFENLLMDLVREGLVSVEYESSQELKIELTSWEDEE